MGQRTYNKVSNQKSIISNRIGDRKVGQWCIKSTKDPVFSLEVWFLLASVMHKWV